MTRQDFVKGWMFLTAQPWGKAYRTNAQSTVGGEPSPADLQSEFYYKAFHQADPELWLQVCQLQAMGETWPSVMALKQSLRDCAPKRQALPAPSHDSSYVTLEEFGITLFEAIKTIAMIGQCKEEPTAPLRMRLAKQITTLTENEMQQILKRCPQVAKL